MGSASLGFDRRAQLIAHQKLEFLRQKARRYQKSFPLFLADVLQRTAPTAPFYSITCRIPYALLLFEEKKQQRSLEKQVKASTAASLAVLALNTDLER
mmetsp:Transcript_3254/g.20244  ORF Transcript_3254/g.20244 Transcript_3254/m.20244 type:complete len:98 (+) Transcript_3254:5005-5298(+)